MRRFQLNRNVEHLARVAAPDVTATTVFMAAVR
jgi:hypothetical protein